MTDGQYVYVVANQVPPQNVNTPWVAGDHQDETARIAFQSVLQVYIFTVYTTSTTRKNIQYSDEHVENTI